MPATSISTTTPSTPSRVAPRPEHTLLPLLHPRENSVQQLGLGAACPATAPQERPPAALHPEGRPVILADQPCHPLHAALDHLLDVGRPARPRPVPRDLGVDLRGGKAHDLVAAQARVPDNAEVAEGHALEAGLEEVEGPGEVVGDLGLAGADDLVVGAVVAGDSGVLVSKANGVDT